MWLIRKINVFSNLNKQYDIFIEYGLQSKHDKTLNYINRGHRLIDFENAFLLTKSVGLKVCVHIIFGLPYETKDMMLDTVNYLTELGIDAIKFHHLQIVKNTKIAEIYKENPFSLLTEDEYIKILAEALSLLPSNVIISRLVGNTKKDLLVAPKEWPSSTVDFVNKLSTYMINNNMYQGNFTVPLYFDFFFQFFGHLISIVVVLMILSGRKEARATLTWLFIVILFPYLGAFLYLIFGNPALRIMVDITFKREVAINIYKYYSQLEEFEKNEKGQMILKVTNCKPTLCYDLEVLTSAREKYNRLIDDIKKQNTISFLNTMFLDKTKQENFS